MLGFRKFENGWRFRAGPVYLRYFHRAGFRLVVSFSSARAIRLFGFNQRTVDLFYREKAARVLFRLRWETLPVGRQRVDLADYGGGDPVWTC